MAEGEAGIPILLRYAGLPPLGGQALEFRPPHCLCRLLFGTVDAQSASIWRRVLSRPRPLGLDFISVAGAPLSIEVQLDELTPAGENMVASFSLSNLPPEAEAILNCLFRLPAPPALVPPAAPPAPVPEAAPPAKPAAKPDAPAETSDAILLPIRTAPQPQPWQNPFRSGKLGEVLVRMGKLSEAQVQDALQRARATGRRLGRFLLQEGLVSADEVCRALSLQSGLPMTDLNRAEVTPELGRLFPFATLEKLVFVPFDESRKLVCIAASDPLSKEMVADLEAACQRKIEVFLAQEELVLAQLDRLRPHSEAEQRWQSRYLASLPVSYQFCNRLGRTMIQKTFQGRTVDVGQGGLLMEGPGPEPLTPDEVRRRGLCLNVTLSLPPLEAKALCGIRAVKGLEHSPSWHWGLQILEMSAEERRILKEICLRVSHKLDEARGAPPAAAPPA